MALMGDPYGLDGLFGICLLVGFGWLGMLAAAIHSSVAAMYGLWFGILVFLICNLFGIWCL